MATVNDFIGTYLSINDLLLKREQQALAEKNAQINRLALIQEMSSRLTGAGAVTDLATQQGAAEGMDLQTLLGGTAPGEGTVRRGLEREGLDAMGPGQRAGLAEEAATRGATGAGTFQLNQEGFLNSLLGGVENQGNIFKDQLTRGFISRLATGQDQGSLAQASALAGRGPDALGRGADLSLGIGISDTDQAQMTLQAEIAAAGNRLQWADLTQRGALTEAGWAHEFNMTMGALSKQAESAGDINATSELQNISSFLRNMEAGKQTMSETEIELHLEAVKTSFMRLRQAGYPAPDFTDVTVDDIKGDAFGGIKKWFAGQQREINR